MIAVLVVALLALGLAFYLWLELDVVRTRLDTVQRQVRYLLGEGWAP